MELAQLQNSVLDTVGNVYVDDNVLETLTHPSWSDVFPLTDVCVRKSFASQYAIVFASFC